MSYRKTFIVCVIAALSVSIAGCRDTAGPNSSDFGDDCQETDTVNYGCIDIQGTVTGARGQPLQQIDISPVAGTATGLSSDFALTDFEGHYELRLLETAGPAETVSFSLKATVRTNAGVEVASQTLVVTVPVTPVGERPDPVTVNFTIPVN